MHVMERLLGKALVLNVSGRLSFYSRKVFQAVIQNAGVSDVEHIVIDLSDVTCMDSVALGCLALAQLNLDSKNVQMSLVASSPHIRELLDQTHISQFIPTYDSDAQIVSALNVVQTSPS